MDYRLLCLLAVGHVGLMVADQWSSECPVLYTAAVYEHEVIMPPTSSVPVSRERALQNMEKNLAIFRLRAAEARQQGADILVFPEDGLYGYSFNRKTILPYLEFIPEPGETDLAPCNDADPQPGSEVQRAFSCMAQQNGLYLVADMGDKQPCRPRRQRACPSDGRLQFNTAVAYGPDGRLLAKYHKLNLYKEIQFDYPEPEVKYFDTPFGRFGLMICFDILFREPLIEMVTTHNVRNIAFPTAWMDSMPLLSALGFHSSIARGLGVNILSANLHLPAKRFQGSGIFTADGVRSFYYNNTAASGSRLLVSQVSVIGEPADVNTSDPAACKHITKQPKIHDNFHSLHEDIFTVTTREKTEVTNTINAENTQQFNQTYASPNLQNMSVFDIKNYTFLPLAGNSSSEHLCRKGVCCNLTYARLDDKMEPELYVLGVFDGLFHNKYYFQVCTVLKCPSTNRSTCGSPCLDSSTRFTSLVLTGIFQTDFVYPQLVLSRDGQLELAQSSQWTFRNGTLEISDNVTTPLLSATLIGRVYSLDAKLQRQSNIAIGGFLHTPLLLFAFPLMQIVTA